MSPLPTTLLILTGLTALAPASAFAMDAQRGAEVLREQNCLRCHNVAGEGGLAARDLSERLLGNYTSSSMAAVLWNHLPEMWRQMSQDLVGRPQPTARDAEDMFAYLYSLRFFDQRGQYSRGQRAFERKNCARCHSLTDPASGPGPAVSRWERTEGPFALVQQMWNHSSTMRNAATAFDVKWQTLNGRDLADIATFVQQTQGRTPGQAAPGLTFPDASSGRQLFQTNCGGCHPGIVPLESRLRNETLTGIAAGIWNHLPRMQALPLVSSGDMAAIVSYLWEMQYSQPEGDPAEGARVFEDKQCATCHNDATGASRIARGERVFTPFTMISLWFEHGPIMEQAMQETRTRWPFLSEENVADLVAYMNTRP